MVIRPRGYLLRGRGNGEYGASAGRAVLVVVPRRYVRAHGRSTLQTARDVDACPALTRLTHTRTYHPTGHPYARMDAPPTNEMAELSVEDQAAAAAAASAASAAKDAKAAATLLKQVG